MTPSSLVTLWGMLSTHAAPPPVNVIHHSDRGIPYASHDYGRLLARHGFLQSMSHKGDCWDKAVAESFFGTMKGEYADHEIFSTRQEAEKGIAKYIEDFYNLERRHSTLDYLSPIEYELRSHADLRVA